MKKHKLLICVAFIFVVLLLTPQPNQAATPWNVIAYDDGAPESYFAPGENDSVAVRFTPPSNSFKLTSAIIYGNTSEIPILKIWVLNATNYTIMNPIAPPGDIPPSPYTIDFGSAGPIFTQNNVSDFYIVVQWNTNETDKFGLGIDSTSTSGRSFTNLSGVWQAIPSGNIMIRAQFGDVNPPAFDHVPLSYAVVGRDLSVSVRVTDDFGVEAVILGFREKGTNDTFGLLGLSLESGNALDGIWYGFIPGINVSSTGIEYYIYSTDKAMNQQYHRNASNPFEVTAIEMFEMPLWVSIVIIASLGAATLVVYILLPEYHHGEDKK